MQKIVINKTVLAMRLGLILAVSYVVRDLLPLFAGDGIFSIVALFISIFFLIFPFVFLYRMTVNFCCQYNDYEYEFFTPFSISIRGFAFAGIIYTLCMYIYIKTYAPNYMSDMVDAYEKMMAGQGYDELISQWKEVAATSTPKSLIPAIYLGFMIMGVFVSLVAVGTARFAKLRKPVEGVETSTENNDSQYDKSESDKKDN